MRALRTGAPAQEHVGGRLHQALAHDHPLAGMGISAFAGIGLQHASGRLLHLQEGRAAGFFACAVYFAGPIDKKSLSSKRAYQMSSTSISAKARIWRR